MAFVVQIISEDHTNDQFILKPLVEKLFEKLGKPNAKVALINNPRLKGFEHALSEVNNICEAYDFADLILFLPDRDCKNQRSESLAVLENKKREEGIPFFAECAIEEVEAWLLSGHLDKLDSNWTEIRADCSVKENVFEPFLLEHGNDNPGNGRVELMQETLLKYNGMKQRCPEIQRLATRIKNHLEDNAS